MKRFSNPFKALKNRNFLIYWVGLSASQTGSWMQNIAQPWLALLVTNDPALVGVVSAAQFAPILLFSLFLGPLIDKADKKRILFFTQGGLCAVSLAFACAVIFDFASYPVILSLALATGIFNSLDSPCRHSFIHELVGERELIPNAVALNSMSIAVSRVLGPALAGLVMAEFGIAECFLANTFSFVAIFASLIFIRPTPLRRERGGAGLLDSVSAGLEYIRSRELLLSPLIVLLIAATLIPNYSVTVSALVKFELNLSERDFGYLMSSLGVGAFFGALWTAFRSQASYTAVRVAPFLAAASLACVGLARDFWSVAVLLALTSFIFITAVSSINSLLQLRSRGDYRGRVMSVFSLFFLGSTPIGASLAGFISKEFGAGRSFMICGASTAILLAIWWAWRYFKFNSNLNPKNR